MANIIQIKDKDVIQYPQTVADAVLGLTDLTNVVSVPITFKTGFSSYSSTNPLKAYLIGGKTLQFTGIFTNAAEIDKGANVVIATIPEQYAPEVQSMTLCQGSSVAIFLLTVNATGEITLSRYKRGDTEFLCPANSWLTCGNLSTIVKGAI